MEPAGGLGGQRFARLTARTAVRRRRRIAFALLLSLLVIPNFAHADGGDFSLDFVAAGPFSYNHTTLAGTGPGLPQYDGRVIDQTTGVVESLEGGDFACGDKVIYFTEVTTGSGAVGTQNIRITYAFDAGPAGPAGAGFRTPVTASYNVGDSGNVGTAGVSLFSSSVSSGTLTVVVDVTGLEANDVAIVRVVVTLACPGPPQPGGGNLQARVDSAEVTSPTPDAINVGAQTIPLKNVQDIVAPTPNLTITKTPDGGTVNVGSPVVFTITVNSTGATDALLVSLTDTLPAALAPWTVTGTTGSPTCNISGGNLLTCTKATLAPGTSFSVTVTSANTTGANCGVVNNTATVQATGVSPKNDSGDVSVLCAPNLVISKTPDGGTVPVGSPVVFTIAVDNIGTSEALNVGMTDPLPAALAPWTITGTTGSPTCNITGGTLLICTKASLPAGAGFTVTVTSANTTGANCGVVNNTAFIGTDVLVVSDPGDVTVLCAPDLTISKTPDGGTVNVGSPVVFTITVNSTGPVAAQNVSLTDTLPAALAPWTITGTTGSPTCNIASGNLLTCTKATLAAGTSFSVTVTSANTTDVDCGVVNNTAFGQIGTLPPESDSGFVTVECPGGGGGGGGGGGQPPPPPAPAPAAPPAPAPAPVVEQPPAPPAPAPTEVLPVAEEQPPAETAVLAVAKKKLAVTGQPGLGTLALIGVAFMAAGLALIVLGGPGSVRRPVGHGAVAFALVPLWWVGRPSRRIRGPTRERGPPGRAGPT